MKKKVLSMVMVFLLTLTLAACGEKATVETEGEQSSVQQESGSSAETETDAPQTPKGEEITLRFSWWGGDARHEATLKAIDVYQKAHPGVTVEAEYSSFSGYYEKLVTQLASGNAPDFFQVDQGWVAELYARGDAFADFGSYKDSIDLTTVPEQMMTDYCIMDGQTVVLPFGYNGTVFLYNKSLLADWCDENGNLAMETWDDFIRIGKELHEKNPEAYMTTSVTDGYLRYILKPMLEQITNDIDVRDDFTLGFDESQMTQAYESFMKIFDEGVSQPYEEAVLYDSCLLYTSTFVCLLFHQGRRRLRQPVPQTDSFRRGRKASETGFAQGGVHLIPDFTHGVEDLIGRDIAPDTGKRHIGRRHRTHGADDIAFDAWHLHEPRHGIADQSQQILKSHGGCIRDLFRRAAPKLHQCAGSHGTGASDLGLTSSARPRDGCPVRNDLADAGAGVKRLQYPAFRTAKAVIAGD